MTKLLVLAGSILLSIAALILVVFDYIMGIEQLYGVNTIIVFLVIGLLTSSTIYYVRGNTND